MIYLLASWWRSTPGLIGCTMARHSQHFQTKQNLTKYLLSSHYSIFEHLNWCVVTNGESKKRSNWDSAGASWALFTVAAQSEPVGTTQLTSRVSDAYFHLSGHQKEISHDFWCVFLFLMCQLKPFFGDFFFFLFFCFYPVILLSV